jgi:hypothetical protein
MMKKDKVLFSPLNKSNYNIPDETNSQWHLSGYCGLLNSNQVYLVT